ncbi:MAG: hypothetical protein IIZ27_06805 [Solobacterium sp.]|nr:hypothetical protein [Solobacterium sp.]
MFFQELEKKVKTLIWCLVIVECILCAGITRTIVQYYTKPAILFTEDTLKQETLTGSESKVYLPLPEHTTLEETLQDLEQCSVTGETIKTNVHIPAVGKMLLRKNIRAIEEEGSLGFILLDLRHGQYLSYNTEQLFYPASTIKAHFAASLVDTYPELFKTRYNDLLNLLVWSDNDTYFKMAVTYGIHVLDHWCEKAGVRKDIAANMYINQTTMENARLWAVNYYWFIENETGQKLSELYESPYISSIHSNAEPGENTRTKAGWFEDIEEYYATSDAGIVYEGDHPYMLVIMTDLPADFELLDPLTITLMSIHTEMIKNESKMFHYND